MKRGLFVLGGLLGALVAACGDDAPREAPPAAAVPPWTDFEVRGRWEDPRALTVRIETDGGSLTPAAFRAAAERALDLWRATGVVDFAPARTDRVPSFTIGWGFRHGATLDDGVAQAGPVQPDSFVALDPSLDWNAADAPDVVGTLAHEIGHVLGFAHNEDPHSILYPVASGVESTLGELDVRALHSLYGGGGEPAPGDLVVLGDALESSGTLERAPALRGVALQGVRELLVTDTDGDGADEILVWTTDPKMFGATRVYRFGPGPRLVRTDGPIFALVGRGEVRADRSLDGERVLVTRLDAERYSLAVLDERGRPSAGLLPPPVQLASGALDEDGDGRFEVPGDEPDEVVPPAGVERLGAGLWRATVDGRRIQLDRLFPCDLDGDLVDEWVGRVTSASPAAR
ncbi:MAG: matrixin family metalloprotease [Planctomycetota bacterium]